MHILSRAEGRLRRRDTVIKWRLTRYRHRGIDGVVQEL